MNNVILAKLKLKKNGILNNDLLVYMTVISINIEYMLTKIDI